MMRNEYSETPVRPEPDFDQNTPDDIESAGSSPGEEPAAGVRFEGVTVISQVDGIQKVSVHPRDGYPETLSQPEEQFDPQSPDYSEQASARLPSPAESTPPQKSGAADTAAAASCPARSSLTNSISHSLTPERKTLGNELAGRSPSLRSEAGRIGPAGELPDDQGLHLGDVITMFWPPDNPPRPAVGGGFTRGYMMSDGFNITELVLKRNTPADLSCQWQICPQLEYTRQKALHQSLREVGLSHPGLMDDAFIERKKVKDMDRDGVLTNAALADRELVVNRIAEHRLRGRPLEQNTVVQLRHMRSGKFLSLKSGKGRTPGTVGFEVIDTGDEGAWFSIASGKLSVAKSHDSEDMWQPSEYAAVKVTDQVQLESYSLNGRFEGHFTGYLHLNDSGQGKHGVKSDEYDIHAAKTPTSFTMTRVRKFDDAGPAVRAYPNILPKSAELDKHEREKDRTHTLLASQRYLKGVFQKLDTRATIHSSLIFPGGIVKDSDLPGMPGFNKSGFSRGFAAVLSKRLSDSSKRLADEGEHVLTEFRPAMVEVVGITEAIVYFKITIGGVYKEQATAAFAALQHRNPPENIKVGDGVPGSPKDVGSSQRDSSTLHLRPPVVNDAPGDGLVDPTDLAALIQNDSGELRAVFKLQNVAHSEIVDGLRNEANGPGRRGVAAGASGEQRGAIVRLNEPEFVMHIQRLVGLVVGLTLAAPPDPKFAITTAAAATRNVFDPRPDHNGASRITGIYQLPAREEYVKVGCSTAPLQPTHAMQARGVPDFLMPIDDGGLVNGIYRPAEEDLDEDEEALGGTFEGTAITKPTFILPSGAETLGFYLENDGAVGQAESQYKSTALDFEKAPVLQAAVGGKAFSAYNAAKPAEPTLTEVKPEPDDFIHASCFCFKRSGIVRRSCSELSQSTIFEALVIMLIVANSVTLAMYDPLAPESDSNKSLDQVGKYFTLAFTVEMLIKVVANGMFIGPYAYLKDSAWNWLDFIVVTTGYMDFIPNYDNKLGVFRTVRLLRPLRTISSIRGMRLLVGTLLKTETVKGVGGVCFLMLFILTVFGIVGVNLFSGALRHRCIFAESLAVTDQICTTGGTGHQCGTTGSPVEGDVDPALLFCSDVDPITGLRIENPGYGYVSFDDFGLSVLTIFTMITLEGWTDVMYAAQDGVSGFVWVYFVALIVFGTFIALQLFVAVISTGYCEIVEEDNLEETKRANAKELLNFFTESVYTSVHRNKQPLTDLKAQRRAEALARGNKEIEEGDLVRLKPNAAERFARNKQGNLRAGSEGYAVKVADRAGVLQVRVDIGVQPRMSKRPQLYWYREDNLEKIVTLNAVKGGPAAAPAPDPLKPSEELIKLRIAKFFDNFDGDGDTDPDQLLDHEEWKAGIAKLANAPLASADDETAVVLLDPMEIFEDDDQLQKTSQSGKQIVLLLLELLTDPSKIGKEKEWQQQMNDMMFDAIDENGNGLITRTEFYNHFMDPAKFEVEEEEVLTCADLGSENMKGLSCKQVFQIYCRWLINKGWFGHIITFVVLFNCAVLGYDHYGMSESMENVLEALNLTCTIIFCVELVLKLFGLGIHGYFDDSFNTFDFSIVMMSLVEMFLPESPGLSVFRALRILRVFKVTRSLENFRKVLVTVINVIPELANFFGLVFLFVFFFGVMGLHLFGGTFTVLVEGDTQEGIDPVLESHPRANFDTFGTAMLAVFQILTGENWNILMYNTIEANGTGALIYFIVLVVVGIYMLLNLFLAVLMLKNAKAFMPDRGFRDDILHRSGQLHKPTYTIEEEDDFNMEGVSLFLFKKDSAIRQTLKNLCANPYFDGLILFCIIVSSLSLAVEEPQQAQEVVDILEVMDLVFTIIFTFEMAAKMIVLCCMFGSPYAYWKNSWNLLDGSIVIAAWASRLLKNVIGDVGYVKGFRVLRALRPLRVIKRVPELKLVVNSLFRAIPTVGNVLMLLIMYWLVFAILGSQLFGGKLYYCNDPDAVTSKDCVGTLLISCGEEVSPVYPFINRECMDVYNSNANITGPSPGFDGWKLVERRWASPSGWGFDNIGQSLLTLFEVATLEMWLDIMYWVVDSAGVGIQPVFENAAGFALFFVIFVVVGTFFMLELFVGAIVTSYNMLNEESAGGAFQSERQKKQVEEAVLSKGDEEFVPRYGYQQGLYDIVVESAFVEKIVSGCIVLNILVMALSNYDMSTEYKGTLDGMNDVFTGIFALEATLKLLAELPNRYFKNGWNQYDFFVVVVTCGDFIYTKVSGPDAAEIPGAMVLRVFRIARIVRLLQKSRSLMDLFLTVAYVLPSLFNVGMIMCLLFFIYGVLGMHMFGRVVRGEFLNAHANFETFPQSLLAVFRMVTGESWNGLMHDCSTTTNCNSHEDCAMNCCGSAAQAPIYFVSFQLLGQYIFMNMFIAVMLVHFERQKNAVEPHITSVDHEKFHEIWGKFVGKTLVMDGTTPRYEISQLLPVELFDDLMTALPASTGWTLSERRQAAKKRKAMLTPPLSDLPVRSMQLLTKFGAGMNPASRNSAENFQKPVASTQDSDLEAQRGNIHGGVRDSNQVGATGLAQLELSAADDTQQNSQKQTNASTATHTTSSVLVTTSASRTPAGISEGDQGANRDHKRKVPPLLAKRSDVLTVCLPPVLAAKHAMLYFEARSDF
jgi:hypothetical protein